MIFKNTNNLLFTLLLPLFFLYGCRASGNLRAPVEERDVVIKKTSAGGKKAVHRDLDVGPQTYVIQKGDTLYSIAFEHGLDYREVAEQNNIDNPSTIQIGQQIKLLPPSEGGGEKGHLESKPIIQSPPPVVPIKDQPKLAKIPYTELAILQIEKIQNDPGKIPTKVVTASIEKPTQEAETGNDESIEWGMPTKGKLLSEYSESASRKGIDIAGIKGQVVLASAAGKVVYSGSGLRGYGKLVIIKHNKTYLSAYAHNEQILVKEGQTVTKGQKIAEMGSSDSDQVKLHFEIRKFGKPIDPAKFLNFGKS